MKDIINKLISHKTLSKNEAKSILINISSGKFNNSLISSFLTVFMMRNITLEELQGFKEALLELCIRIDLSNYSTIDLCGTCLLYTSPSPRDATLSRMPSSA